MPEESPPTPDADAPAAPGNPEAAAGGEDPSPPREEASLEPLTDDQDIPNLSPAQAAAIATVTKSTSDEDRRRRVARRRAMLLTCGVIVVVGLFLMTFSGIALHTWFTDKNIHSLQETESIWAGISLFVKQHTLLVRMVHGISAAAALVSLLVMIPLSWSFRHAYLEAPIQREAMPPAPGLVTLLSVLMVGTLLAAGYIAMRELPDRPPEDEVSAQETQRMQGGPVEFIQSPEGIEFTEPDAPRGSMLPVFLEPYEAWYQWHVVLLPMAFGFLMLVFLVPLGTIQKCRITPPGKADRQKPLAK